MSWFKRKPVTTYHFEPKEDITAFELALSMKVSFMSVDLGSAILKEFPESVRRHWRVETK